MPTPKPKPTKETKQAATDYLDKTVCTIAHDITNDCWRVATVTVVNGAVSINLIGDDFDTPERAYQASLVFNGALVRNKAGLDE